MRRFGGTLVRHRWLVVALWIALVAGAQALAAGVGSDLRDEFTVAGTDSQEAADLLEEAFPDTSGDADLFVWRVNEGNALDRGTRSLVQPLLDELETLPSVTAVTSPFGGDRATAEQVSADRRTAYARIQFDGSAEEVPHEEIEDFVDVVEQLDAVPTVSAGASGVVVGQLATPEVGILELIGVLFAAIVLYMAFGSLLAATLPIMVAAAALGVGVAMVMLLSNAMSVPTASVTIGVLLGLGVGIDYALFLVSRYRTALRAGRSVQEAVVESVDSSGRAVVFAGSTVVVSLLGLVLIGLSFLTGIGIAVAVTVLFTIVAAVTLLPAVLAIVGTRVLSRSARRGIAAPAHDAAGGGGEPQAWWVRLLARRPMAAVAVGAAAMLALSVPVEDLRLGTADQGSDPSGSVSRVGYDLLADGFGPGVNGPLLVTAATPDEPARQAADRLSEELRGLDGVASVSPAQASPDRAAALIQVVPTTVPQDEATESLIERIREDVAAPAEAQTPSLSVHVGGSTAMFDDFATTVTDALPMFFAAIIGLSFLLLVLAFRSLLVPALGAVMNALGVAAAFGVMVAIFQWGWGAELLNVDKEGPIEPFIR
jgi:RND superfamily putative drug exporter